MLNGRLALHDIRDVDKFVQTILKHHTNTLTWHDREDLHAYLIATTWELSIHYNPGRSTFSTYARTSLNRRIVDWQRQHHGRTRWQFRDRTYTRDLPTLVPLDATPVAHTQAPRDPSADSAADLARLLRTRGSDEAWHQDIDSRSVPRRAA